MTNLGEATGECEKAKLYVFTRIWNPNNIFENLDVTVKGEKKSSGKQGVATFENLEVGKAVDVEVDLGAQAEKFAWKSSDAPVAKGSYMIKSGEGNRLGFEAVPLPRIKVTVYRSDGNSLKPEPKIEVVVTPSGGEAVKKPSADNTGVAQFDHLKKGIYKVEVKLTDPQLETFVLPPAQDNIDLPLGVEKPLTFTLKVKGTLKVEIERFDKRALSQAAKVTLKEVATGKTLPAQLTVGAQNPNGNTPWGLAELKLAPGKYEVTIEPQKDEKDWKIAPKMGKNLPVTVESEKTAELLCKLSPYQKVQFVAFDIRPGTKNAKHYLGEKDADTDIRRRCEVMKEAIKAAAGHGSIDPAASTLKIFMAPEFYYRGAEGGYPVEKISTIMDPTIDTSMPEETDKSAYKHWLFLFGTAIGYLPHEKVGDSGKPGWSGSKLLHQVGPMKRARLRIIDLNRIGNVMKVKVGVSLVDRFEVKGTAVWHLKQKAPMEAIQQVIRAEAVEGQAETWLHLKDADLFQNGAEVFLESSEESIYIRDIAAINENTPEEQTCLLVKGALFKNIIPRRKEDKKIRWKVIQKHRPFDIERTIERISDGPNNIENEYWLILDSKAEFNPEKPIELSEPISAEIFNVALVRRGGPQHDDWKPGLRQAVVFKEYVSPIDYLGKHKGKGSFHNPDGSGREIIIYGKTRTVLPTAGSRDYLGDSGPINESEINETGQGGGCVVTMDGVTYGIEICLDHAMQRVYNFYVGGPAKPGDPKPQVILIPSWGMTIGGGSTFALPSAPIFNVDGSGGGSIARMHEILLECENGHPVPFGVAPATPCTTPKCGTVLVGPAVSTRGGTPAVSVAGQDELFDGAAGQVIVFEAKEIPDAEVV